MKTHYIKRIIKEDFPPKVQEWIDTLLYPLNQNIEQFNEIFSHNVNLSDNIQSTLKTVTISGSSPLRGDTVAGSATISNPAFYQASINGNLYGVQQGLAIQGVGIFTGTAISTATDTAVTLTQACQYTQKGAEFLVGGNFPITFTHGLKVKPSVVLIVKVDDQISPQTYQTQAFCPQWDVNNDNVVIKAISGLQSGRTYKITFLVL